MKQEVFDMKSEILKVKNEIEKLNGDLKEIEFCGQNISADMAERILELSKNVDKIINDYAKSK